MDTQKTFATVLGCMDGRCQEKTTAFAKELFGADYIDTVTEPGIDGLLSEDEYSTASAEQRDMLRAWAQTKASISAKGHGSTQALVVGHCQCAGDPVSLSEHQAHVRAAVARVQGWNLFAAVRGAYFDESWNLQLLEEVA